MIGDETGETLAITNGAQTSELNFKNLAGVLWNLTLYSDIVLMNKKKADEGYLYLPWN